jgi:multicomponent K+:H+ antiporter subunit A
MPQHIILIALIVLPFAGSIVIALLPDSARNAAAWLAGAVAITGLIIVSAFYPAVLDGVSIRHDMAWLPQFGLTFSLRLDGFAWAFSILITGIGALVMLYARYYISPTDPVARFFSLLLAFMGAMLGIALSGNLIQLVFFWELTSILSFLLIGYWHHSASARAGARMALTVTATGGLCLFAGVIVLGHIVGSYDLDVVLKSGDQIRAHPLYLTALILVLLGALTKSAQFPFHFWLPQAMNAPTPVSAYLHSAAMVKAGVFLLVRLWPAMGGTDYWLWFVGTAGLATFILGAFLAVFQQDLKGLLAYSTISHLGLITLLIGLDRPLALVAAIFHMFNHATFKASLFMAAGIIDHETGTRDIRRLSGLWRFMPITAFLAMVAAAAWPAFPCSTDFCPRKCSSPRRSKPTMARCSTTRCPISSRWPACSASRTRCVSSVTFSLARRRRTCRKRPTSRPAGCDSRSRYLWSLASWSGLFRRSRSAQSSIPRYMRYSGRPSHNTAWLSGTGLLSRSL